jgi:hypothetical protein
MKDLIVGQVIKVVSLICSPMTLKNDRIVKTIGFFDTLELADIWERIPI